MNKNLQALFFSVFFIGIFSCFGYFYLSLKETVKIIDKSRWQANNQILELKKDLLSLKKEDEESSQKASESENSSKFKDAVELQKSCKGSIVQIFSDILETNWIEPYEMPKQHSGCGSGFFIDEEGHFLTNFHVIGHNLRTQIQMPELGQERLGCDVIGVCPERDIALLKVKDEDLKKIIKKIKKIEYLPFGDSDVVQRGSNILALGFPLGKQVIKSTTGIVSGWETVATGDRGGALSCLEITAPINPGSSGGPAINKNGEVIGVNFAGLPGAQNVGYVLPINELKSAIKDMRNIKLLRKPKLGVVFHSTTPEFAEHLGNPEGGGFYVAKPLKGEIAQRSGLMEGDVVYEVNGYKIDYHGDTVVPWREDKVSFISIIQRLEVGDKVNMVVYRNGQRKEIEFSLEEEKKMPDVRLIYPGYEKIDYEVFGGLVVMQLTLNHVALLCEHLPKLTRYLPPAYERSYDKKLIITNVQATSEAHNTRGILSPGKFIEKINGRVVTTIEELRHELKEGIEKDFVTIDCDNNWFCVLNMKKIVEDEKRLSKMFKYGPENSIVLSSTLN